MLGSINFESINPKKMSRFHIAILCNEEMLFYFVVGKSLDIVL